MGKSIRLADGTLLEPKINFLTIKLLQEAEIDKFKDALNGQGEDATLSLDCFGKIIYALIRSSGRKVDEEEAMTLIPLDDMDTLLDVLGDFIRKIGDFKKKPTSSGKKKKKK